jgi:branched-subunit amino acid aminotransferase/4-amino-4-deoxychorismate lyase
VAEGRPLNLVDHLLRLARGAEALAQPAPWIRGLDVEIRAWLAAAGTRDDRALRLALHGAEGLVSACLEPLPSTPHPYRLAPLPHPRGDLRGSTLARHKGLSGPWRPPVLAEARKRGAEDALLLWPDGTLVETTLAALALEVAGTLLLPPPDGRVASLAEALELPAWAAARGLAPRWEGIRLDQVAGGRLWCLNAVRGFWPAILLGSPAPEDPPWASRI